jgi:hypothetical protein
MVRQMLTPDMIKEGKALLQELDRQKLGITAAFWFYLESSDVWTLIIASPKVEQEGPKSIYGRIQTVLTNGATLTLRDISVVPSDDPVVKLLGAAIKTRPDEVGDIRFSRNTINGHFVEDAYIYRLA